MKKSDFITHMKRSRDNGYQAGIRFSVQNYSAAVLLCLKDKFDFSTDQLVEVTGYINDTFDSICQGYLTLDDIAATLKEENDIDIRFVNSEAVTNE